MTSHYRHRSIAVWIRQSTGLLGRIREVIGEWRVMRNMRRHLRCSGKALVKNEGPSGINCRCPSAVHGHVH